MDYRVTGQLCTDGLTIVVEVGVGVVKIVVEEGDVGKVRVVV